MPAAPYSVLARARPRLSPCHVARRPTAASQSSLSLRRPPSLPPAPSPLPPSLLPFSFLSTLLSDLSTLSPSPPPLPPPPLRPLRPLRARACECGEDDGLQRREAAEPPAVPARHLRPVRFPFLLSASFPSSLRFLLRFFLSFARSRSRLRIENATSRKKRKKELDFLVRTRSRSIVLSCARLRSTERGARTVLEGHMGEERRVEPPRSSFPMPCAQHSEIPTRDSAFVESGPLNRDRDRGLTRSVRRGACTLDRNNLQQVWRDFSVQYGGKYFGIKGSARPVFHVILGVFALSYALEYPHLSTYSASGTRTLGNAQGGRAGGRAGRRAGVCAACVCGDTANGRRTTGSCVHCALRARLVVYFF